MKLRLHLCLLAVTAHWLCAADSGKFPAAAKVLHPVKEADLATLTLTPEAEKRLGIATALVERRKVERARLFGGETILPARRGGNTNAAAQSVFAILPSLSSAELVRLAQSQIDADGQVDQARLQLDAAKTVLNRAEQLLRDMAGTARAVDDARAQVSLAESGLRIAQARRDLLGPPVLEGASPSTLWVRVPVYVGDSDRLDPTAAARIGGLADPPGSSALLARPVSAPPSANAGAATVDWFYEVPNKEGALRLGQRVGVTIPLRTAGESLVLPWSAVVLDFHGGTWVYEKIGPQSYARRRVQVQQVTGELAALADGVKPGAAVVITGVAELFGTEFGAGK